MTKKKIKKKHVEESRSVVNYKILTSIWESFKEQIKFKGLKKYAAIENALKMYTKYLEKKEKNNWGYIMFTTLFISIIINYNSFQLSQISKEIIFLNSPLKVISLKENNYLSKNNSRKLRRKIADSIWEANILLIIWNCVNSKLEKISAIE